VFLRDGFFCAYILYLLPNDIFVHNKTTFIHPGHYCTLHCFNRLNYFFTAFGKPCIAAKRDCHSRPYTIFYCMLFGELFNKAVEVTIEADVIKISKFLGLLEKQTYLFSALAGYKTNTFSYRQNHYEKLCIFKDEKIVAEISSYFHEDYALLKDEVSGRLKYLGEPGST